jgi:3-hydroxyisobutyrate dehydrogenase
MAARDGRGEDARVAVLGTGIMGSAMARNLVCAGGVAEALELAGRLGIDASELAETIEGGPLDAPIADAKLHKMERADFAPEFPLEWALKDVDLAIEAAGDDELPLLAALSRQWRAAVDAGHGREDVSVARLALGDPLAPLIRGRSPARAHKPGSSGRRLRPIQSHSHPLRLGSAP